MSNDPKQLDYSHLSVLERVSLAQELWDSVHEHAADIPLTQAEHQELDHRWTAYESGSMTASSWPEVKQRLLKE